MGKVKAFLMLSLIALGYSSALAALSTQDRAIIPSWQLLVNPGFESGTQGWTASGGTFTTTTTAANVGSGLVAGSWDSSAASQTLTSSAVTIPSGAYGRPAILSCNIQTPSGSATHKIQAWDGTNVLAEATIQSSTQYRASSVMFQMPGSGSIRARLISVASNEPSINVDDCAQQVLQSDVVVPVAQASLVGSAFIAGVTNCLPTVVNSGFADFAADTDCVGPTIETNIGPGVIQTTDTDRPEFTVNSLPPGIYKVRMQVSTASGATTNFAYRISDGTTNSQAVFQRRDNAATSGIDPITLTAVFNYSSSGNRTFKMQCQGDGAASCSLLMNQTSPPSNLQFVIERFPSTAETGVRPDVLPASWNGYHGSNCTYDRSGTSLGDFPADATCDFVEMQNVNFGTVTSQLSGSDKLPGIVFTPRRAGRYLIIANYSGLLTSLGTTSTYELYDGTNSLGNSNFSAPANEYVPHTLQGVVNAASTSAITVRIRGAAAAGSIRITGPGSPSTSHIRWTIIALDQSFPAPLLAGSVTSNSSGLERIERAAVSEFTTCTSSPCTITRQSGSWLTSVTRSSMGNFTLNIAPGIFSATPSCSWSVTNAFICRSTSSGNTSTAIGLDCRNQAGGADELNSLYVICMGPR
jgi:hypothetical protein